MFSLKKDANSAYTLIYPNILFFLQETDHVTNIIRKLIVLKSVKEEKDFLPAQLRLPVTRANKPFLLSKP